MTPEQKLHSDLAVPPGEYLAEVISELGADRTELAAYLCLSVVELDSLLAGNTPLTQALARRLGEGTSVPDNIWLGLEKEFRWALARLAKGEHPNDQRGRSVSL